MSKPQQLHRTSECTPDHFDGVLASASLLAAERPFKGIEGHIKAVVGYLGSTWRLRGLSNYFKGSFKQRSRAALKELRELGRVDIRQV